MTEPRMAFHDEKVVIFVRNQTTARLLELFLQHRLATKGICYGLCDTNGGRGTIFSPAMKKLQKDEGLHWKLYRGNGSKQQKEKEKEKEHDSTEETNDGKMAGQQVYWEMNGTSAKTMAMEAFSQDESCRVFITTFGTSAHGVDLQVARNVIMAESVYNPAVMLQAEDRAYRLGQKRDVYVYYLQSCTSRGYTVEKLVFDILKKKRRMIRETIEGGAVELDSLKELMYQPSQL